MENYNEENTENDTENIDDVENASAFRRICPQVLGSLANSLTPLNFGELFGLLSIVIPSLTGFNQDLNPNETLQITADQASWLPTFTHIAHPFGSLLGGVIGDELGRRKTLILSSIIVTIAWMVLVYSQSYTVICMVFVLFGLIFGLCEPSLSTYGTEICEPAIRGNMMSLGLIIFFSGFSIAISFGSVVSWRYLSFICGIFSVSTVVAMYLVPESPHWLLSKNRFKDAQKSLQWLRGWVSPQTVHDELIQLQNYTSISNACTSCTKQSLRCYHSTPTFCDKIQELKTRRIMRPFILVICLEILANFSCSCVWEPYIIQVMNALGTPIEPSYASVLISWTGISGCIFLLLFIKKLGKRRIYLTSLTIVIVCCFALSIYGFYFFPSGWTSFKSRNETPKDPEYVRNLVGNYSYLAFILVLAMRFCAKSGVDVMFSIYVGEVFPFKLRSFLCGISASCHFILAVIASKTYYNIECWLSLPGAILFYGIISLIGLVVMYFILPETEQRSLEDIERHYSDSTRGLTDIHIRKQSQMDVEY